MWVIPVMSSVFSITSLPLILWAWLWAGLLYRINEGRKPFKLSPELDFARTYYWYMQRHLIWSYFIIWSYFHVFKTCKMFYELVKTWLGSALSDNWSFYNRQQKYLKDIRSRDSKDTKFLQRPNTETSMRWRRTCEEQASLELETSHHTYIPIYLTLAK